MDPAREIMKYDVAIVGGGPSGLAFAIRYRQLQPQASICLLEKGAEIGSHIISGAVMEPGPLDRLLPNWRENLPAICVPARRDEFTYLTRGGRWRLPVPPHMKNNGNFILSLSSLCRWLGEQAEALGVDLFPGFPAAAALHDENGAVIGVRCADMGREKNGRPGPNFTAGVDIHAPLTVLAEGCRGSITKTLIARHNLDQASDPQTYGLGLKELWHLPPGRAEPGLIQHSIGWPLDRKTYGGSFLYHLNDNQVYVGFVAGLDYEDPMFSPFEAFQQFKHHPSIRPLLEGGEILAAGARTLVEGGWQSLPRLEIPGMLIVGDAGGTLNVPKVKGIHMAINSAMLAAEHYAEKKTPEGYNALLRASPIGRELRRVRNIRPGFKKGLWRGIANAAFETLLAGHTPWTLHNHTDYSSLTKLSRFTQIKRGWAKRVLPPRDRPASVFFSQTAHDETQPLHLKVADTSICIDRCRTEYANPCTRFCPAGVYEMIEDDTGRHLQINAANCLHCKACDIKDPYEIITWTVPEGGSGPNYTNL